MEIIQLDLKKNMGDGQRYLIFISTGYKTKNNLFGVYCNEELVKFSSLLTGYGMWGDTIHAAETRRSQGVLRYPSKLMLIVFPMFSSPEHGT